MHGGRRKGNVAGIGCISEPLVAIQRIRKEKCLVVWVAISRILSKK